MEFPVLLVFFAYIYYLRYIADRRTESEKEEARLCQNIELYKSGDITMAFEIFSSRIAANPQSSISYLYRGLCFKHLGDNGRALKDFRTGISYDNTNPDLLTELGKLQRESDKMEDALHSFSTAIRISRGQGPEPYHERGITLQMLNRRAEAEIDFNTENFIRQQRALEIKNATETDKSPLMDLKLLLNSLLVILTSVILILSVKTASSIHLPYLTAVMMSVALGFVEPRRGWILAILQCIIFFIGYMYVIERPVSQGRAELEYFSLYGAIALTFTSSFLGAFLKRALMS
jgi:tetratricopeptide (TPR) repeat protein